MMVGGGRQQKRMGKVTIVLCTCKSVVLAFSEFQ